MTEPSLEGRALSWSIGRGRQEGVTLDGRIVCLSPRKLVYGDARDVCGPQVTVERSILALVYESGGMQSLTPVMSYCLRTALAAVVVHMGLSWWLSSSDVISAPSASSPCKILWATLNWFKQTTWSGSNGPAKRHVDEMISRPWRPRSLGSVLNSNRCCISLLAWRGWWDGLVSLARLVFDRTLRAVSSCRHRPNHRTRAAE